MGNGKLVKVYEQTVTQERCLWEINIPQTVLSRNLVMEAISHNRTLMCRTEPGASIIRNMYWVLCAGPILGPDSTRKTETASLASSSLQ